MSKLVLNIFLRMHPLVAIVCISFLVSLIVTLLYRLLTNQSEMRELKQRLKDYQKEIKEHKNDPKKMMELQKKMMELNMKYFVKSMKPTLISFLPIILILGWMGNHFGYEPLWVGKEFTLSAYFNGIDVAELGVPEGSALKLLSDAVQNVSNGKAVWRLVADEPGEYVVELKYDGESYLKKIIVANEFRYVQPQEKIKNKKLTLIELSNKKLKLLNIFGLKLGWLGSYIIFSLVFSFVLRKLLKVS